MPQGGRTESRIVAVYDYRDAAGRLLFQVVRFEPKDFRQRRPDGTGGWVWNLKGVSRVPYRLPELLAADPATWVFVVEGEKDVESLIALGLVATCNPGGAGKWQDSFSETLRGRRVAVIPDGDAAGWTHAHDVARRLLGTAEMVKIVDLGRINGFQGRDVTDWTEWLDSRTAEELAGALVEMAEAAPAYQPDAETPMVRPCRWQPFPVEVLPPSCRRFAEEAAEALGVDASYIALPVLAGLGAAIGNTRRIALSRSWTAPAVVWAGIVGESGMLKSPAIKTAFAPIYKRQAEALKAHREAMDRYKADLHAHRLAMKDWERTGRKSGEEAPVEPLRPVMERFYCSDTTVEALAERLQDAPRGLLATRDELSGWLGSFGQYKQGKGRDEANWLSMFDAGPLLVDRKTGDRTTIYVPRAAVCVAGGIQPGILRRMFTAEHYESGLAARFLFAMPPRRAKQWTGREVSRLAEECLAEVYAHLWGLAPMKDEEGTARSIDLPLSSAAMPMWVDFVNAHGLETADLTGPLAAAFSKLEGYAARLALIVCLARWTENPGQLGAGPTEVDAESVEAGISIVRWAKNETRRIYAMLREDEDGQAMREILELVERRGGGITVRELQQARHYATADEAEEILQKMVTAGLGHWVSMPPGPKGGRPTKCFRLAENAPACYETSEFPKNSGVS
ncbi:MAG: DUF3987 domain-containing protein [Planctomycetes bacterium]|nr:DUF3987 domain-containing protein [Planctomycetota bacterium]